MKLKFIQDQKQFRLTITKLIDTFQVVKHLNISGEMRPTA